MSEVWELIFSRPSFGLVRLAPGMSSWPVTRQELDDRDNKGLI